MSANANELKFIRRDRMRYENNKLSSNLAIIAIVFNCFFFISIYGSNVGNFYYTLMMGASIVYNLLFMLIVFLVAEGSKSYHIGYSYIAIPVGILQFVRILGYPRIAHTATISLADDSIVNVMGNAQFTRTVLYLCISGICLLLSAAIGIYKCRELTSHLKELEAASPKADAA
ncbi:MAG: hypothetical protein IJ757_08225 [Clostridiales bacterium]|nr:hypothetical protein [Clostridiales bacterium]